MLDGGGDIAGVVLCLISSTMEALGYCFVRIRYLVATEGAPGDLDSVRGVFKRIVRCFYGCEWCLLCVGFGFVLIGACLDFLALGMTKEMIVTTSGGWSLVVNLLLAVFVLGSEWCFYDICAIFLIVSGIVLAVLSCSDHHGDWTVERILDQYSKTSVRYALLFMCLLIFLGSFSLVTDWWFNQRPRYRFSSGVLSVDRVHWSIGFVICFMGALAGNFLLVFGKGVSVFFTDFLSGELSSVGHPLAQCLVVGVVVAMPLQLWFVNWSLSVNDTLFHVPLYYVLWVLGSIATGGVFYDELQSMSLLRWHGFLVAVFVLFSGVVCISLAGRWRRDRQTERRRALYEKEMIGVFDGGGLVDVAEFVDRVESELVMFESRVD